LSLNEQAVHGSSVPSGFFRWNRPRIRHSGIAA
jgi:hypothetical protein